ncbi:ornithine cyclodeaminase family protein [Salinicoccus halodurans]|uniref:ornithine cyclodeaminase family protein n=1 Tax=Salinicoccus halodurans TaxID=407035 RepID=UPI000B310728|nr:hypothetical protein [Salinicoccus halodurans]
MPCISTASKISIIKTVSIFPVNKDLPTTQGNLLVTDLTKGEHKATMDTSYLTRLRTGAMTAIATESFARKDAKTLCAIGTGNMAFEQVLGVVEVRDIERILLYNRMKKKAEGFKKRLEAFGIRADIEVVGNASNVVTKSAILNCATQSTEAVFNGNDLKPGTHINGVGSFKPVMKEMDETTIKRVNQIYADDLESVREEAGELIHAVDAGIISWDDIKGELVDIFEQDYQNDEEIILYKCVDAGYFDLAVAGGVMKMFGE